MNEIVAEFEPVSVRAPFMLRIGAAIIDYFTFIIFPTGGILLARFFGSDGAKLLDSEINNTGWLIGFLVCITNLVIFPMFSGQTLGKMLTGIRVVAKDGTPATFKRIVLRHLLGFPAVVLTLGLGFFITLFREDGRSISDLLAGTMVIFANRKQI